MSSGITDYSVTELDVITDALSNIGVLEDGQTVSNPDLVLCRRKLNMIVKQWAAQADFAPGLKMWTRRRAYLFLQDSQIQYDIGPAGDECASEEYVTTTLSTASGATATLTSATGFATNMRIGIEVSGVLTWTTISLLAGSVATLGASIVAPSGARVFAYTSKPLKPFEIVSGVIRDTDGNDSPVDVNLSSDEYELIPNKTTTGTPSQLYWEAKKTGMRVYLDNSPDDVSKVIRLVFHSYIEDSTAQTDSVDFPAEWFRPLSAQLSLDCCLPFSRPVTPELVKFRDESLQMAKNAHPLKSTAFYASEPDWY